MINMSAVVDTNVLVYAINDNSAEQEACRELLSALCQQAEDVYLPDNVLYEFLRITTHGRVFPKPLSIDKAQKFINALFAYSHVRLLSSTPRHWQILQEVTNHLHHPAGNLFFDIHTVVLMREHGIRRIYTADTDFLKFKEVEVINPLGTR
jgi:uncharacterized protein